jgi:hypothetical protein
MYLNRSILWTLLLIFCSHASFAQQQIQITGQVLREQDNQPVEFATVAVTELKVKTRTDFDGNYVLTFPAAGEYNIIITAPGLPSLEKKLVVTGNANENFVLGIAKIQGAAITIREDRKKQNLSRNTLSIEEIKDTPATFGDALGALSTLPGVVRSGGLFGQLLIRGASDTANRYYIDDIPVLNPQHFGGLQSVISNDIVDRIDLYSSSFPTEYGNAIGAIINIETIDSVEKLGGNIDVSLISSNFLIKDQWQRLGKNSDNSQNGGYWIAAGRVGYLTLLIPPILRLFGEGDSLQLPQYYDYQLKGKYFLDERGIHSFTGLVFGSFDTFDIVAEEQTEEEKQKTIEEGLDPRNTGSLSFNNDVYSNSQGFYYTYRPSSKYKNRLVLFNVINYSRFYIQSDSSIADNNPANQVGTNLINVNVNPNIAGLKNVIEWKTIKDFSELRFDMELNHYYYKSAGTTQTITQPLVYTGQPEPGTTTPKNIDFSTNNQLVSAALSNKFTIAGLEVVPGARVDWLSRRQNDPVVSPRGLVGYSYEPFGTTISAAGGIYYSYPQINQFLFNKPFDQQPQVAIDAGLLPEKSIHRAVGIEQQIEELTSVKVEYFQNSYSDLVVTYIDAGTVSGLVNTGQNESKGLEILLRRDRLAGYDGFYGWLSYTYTESRFKFGLDSLNYGQTWFTNPQEQRHSGKLVAGYIWGNNSLGARFEMFSGNPYTPIIGSKTPETFNGINRYEPIYDSENAYSSSFPLIYRLDIRYSRTSTYSWGEFKWFVEFINVTNYKPLNQQTWNYSQAYSASSNPTLEAGGFNVIVPNFGLEWTF